MGNNIDVTNICHQIFKKDNIITIPYGDHPRAIHFSDPCPHILKSIFVITDTSIREYSHDTKIIIDISNNQIHTITENEYKQKLESIQKNLLINHGNFSEEYIEQQMAVSFLTGNETVLEIGGNIGRNSLVISSLLRDSTNLVVLESDPNIAAQLIENRDLNNMKFSVENAALSKRKLIQSGWNTYPSDELKPGHKWVNTITIEELRNKYNMKFDTLVLDCEGAFYYILLDMPDIMDNINLVIMENDYHLRPHKDFVDFILRKNGFHVEFQLHGGFGPCANIFWQVWIKND